MKLELWAKFNINSEMEWSEDKFALSTKCRQILEENSFTGHSDFLIYGSDEFYRLLDLIGNKYPFFFSHMLELTKKEMDKEKAFVFDSNSVIPSKNDIGYDKKTKYLFENSLTCMNPNDKYPVYVYRKCGIKGTLQWKPEYFKTSESSIINLAVPSNIKKLFNANHISGCHFEALENISKKTSEEMYCLTCDSVMETEFLMDNLCKEHEYFEYKNIFNEGYLIYPRNSLDNIKDFSYTRHTTSGKEGSIIVSQKFRQLYLKEKLKGGSFYPVFETGSDSFNQYNQMMIDLSRVLVQYNSNHVLGAVNKIRAEALLNGVLPN